MKDIILENFQSAVSDLLVRNKSILDILSKYQQSNAKVVRSIIKAITHCGCIQVKAGKQNIPEDATLTDIQKYMDTHLKGKLCKNCRDIIEKEIGNNLFYLANLCNTLDLSLYDIVLKEQKQLDTLGVYCLK